MSECPSGEVSGAAGSKPPAQLLTESEACAVAPDDLKERINNLLWQVLPAPTTLGEADEIAVKMHHLVIAEWAAQGGGK